MQIQTRSRLKWQSWGEYRENLPSPISFTVHGRKIRIFHATPLTNNLYWYEERPEKFFREMADDADILIYGHTHKPYRKDFDGRVFINAGSVGKPKDRATRTCLTLLDIMPGYVRSEFARLSYDVEKMASAIVSSGLPPYFAEMLREGR